MKQLVPPAFILVLVLASCDSAGESPSELPDDLDVAFIVVDTGLSGCYGNSNDEVSCPAPGEPFYGQDGQYDSNPPAYQYDADAEVVLDLNTGLLWEKAHHRTKLAYSAAAAACEGLELAGHDDWRLPTIKELFSLADFRGTVGGEFYLDSAHFDLEIPTEGELTGTHMYEMMGQTWSSTIRPDDPAWGTYFFNFLDGHLKSSPDNPMFEHFYRCVRGTPGVFENDFENHGDGTVTDHATGLVWQAANGMQGADDYQFNWEEALSYCDDLSLGGHDDWRLPDVKELQSIVDYTRADPALDTDVFSFEQTPGTGAYFWSSTSMIDYPDWATYFCFGPCLSHTGRDIHGPGAQRADPKRDNGIDFSDGVGDQRDVVQIDNYVRCVR